MPYSMPTSHHSQAYPKENEKTRCSTPHRILKSSSREITKSQTPGETGRVLSHLSNRRLSQTHTPVMINNLKTETHC